MPLKALLLLGTKVDAMGLGFSRWSLWSGRVTATLPAVLRFENGTPGEAGQRLCCPVAGLWECAARVE